MMFDVKYTPLQDNLIQLNHAIAEMQQFALHRAELDHTNAAVVKAGTSVREVSQAVVIHDDQIGKF